MKVARPTLVHLAPGDIGQLTDAQRRRAGPSSHRDLPAGGHEEDITAITERDRIRYSTHRRAAPTLSLSAAAAARLGAAHRTPKSAPSSPSGFALIAARDAVGRGSLPPSGSKSPMDLDLRADGPAISGGHISARSRVCRCIRRRLIELPHNSQPPCQRRLHSALQAAMVMPGRYPSAYAEPPYRVSSPCSMSCAQWA